MLWYWRAAFAAAIAATVYMMLTPLAGPPPPVPGADKIVHFAVFAVNGLLSLPAFPRRGRRAALCGLLVLGIGLEVLQGWVPHRQATIGDAVANSLGVAFAWLLAVAGGRR